MAKKQILVCASCEKPVEQSGERLVRSCSCPADTEVSAKLSATLKAIAAINLGA